MKTVSQIKGETNVPVVAADHKGLVTEVNERFTSVFGWSREEIVGKPLASIIPTKLRDTHRLGFSRFLRTGRAMILNQPLELKAKRAQQTQLHLCPYSGHQVADCAAEPTITYLTKTL